MTRRIPQQPVHGHVDGDGKLTSADPLLDELNMRAGGAIGTPLAIPQLAALVRLVRRLRIVVSRGVYTADGDRDLDLWVRAGPEGDGVALTIVGWTERPARTPTIAPRAERERDFRRSQSDWHWETDPHLRITALTAAGGGSPRHGVGQPLTRIFTLLPSPSGSLPVIEALSDRVAFDHQRALLAGDVRRPLKLSAVPMLGADGGFGGFSGTATFVAPGDDPDLASASAEEPATDAFAERLGSALRAPLDRIVAGAEAIRVQGDGPLRRDYADYASDIANAGRHLLALVGDLVDLQAIERADFKARDEAIDLADVGRRAAGLLRVRAAARDVRIDPPPTEEDLPARGEFSRALQIMVNLVGNAVRYSPEGGSIWIRGERDGDVVRIVVADQGKGIAAADQARVFEKFERVDPTEPGGTGLGLYIARRLARAMGGDILLDSGVGQGARFMLVLPAG